jgi:hypothetical protein
LKYLPGQGSILCWIIAQEVKFTFVAVFHGILCTGYHLLFTEDHGGHAGGVVEAMV